MADELPIITCAGNERFFEKIHNTLMTAVPRETCTWQRTYGRPVKKVRLSTNFVPFDVHQLPRQNEAIKLFKDPVLHVYWLDCDMETYKKSAREDLFMWHSALKALEILDWLIIVVIHDENRMKTKLLRSSVYDRVKSEFGSRTGASARCIVFSEPFRSAPHSDSWKYIISKIQDFSFEALSRLLTKYEDKIRKERERRNDDDWTFTKYFLLQEQLAMFYSCLEMYEDALVQYDELDALFAQFIVNHSIGAECDWLITYSKLDTGWEGLSLQDDVNMYRQLLIKENKPSILDLRNYLFSQQCKLLVKLSLPEELCNRSLKFIHNTMHELRLLQVDIRESCQSCWMFLTCKELLELCEQFKSTLDMESYSVYTSSIWRCLQSVTHKLGLLYGLLPGTQAPSHPLDSIAELPSNVSSGSVAQNTAKERLNSLLCSIDEYRKYYVELTELTMGTLKYIGHTRMAKLLGLNLAKFYLDSGSPQTAEPFILSSIQSFSAEKWTHLEMDSWKLLSRCEELLGSDTVFIRSCLKICSSSRLNITEREKYLNRLLNYNINNGERLCIQDDEALSVIKIDAVYNRATQHVEIKLTLKSNLPQIVDINHISFIFVPTCATLDKSRSTPDTDGHSSDDMVEPFYINDNKPIAGLRPKNTHRLLKQKDSQATATMLRNLSKSSFEEFSLRESREMIEENLLSTIKPGQNIIQHVTFLVDSYGWFAVDKIKIGLDKFDLLLTVDYLDNNRFYVIDKPPPQINLIPGLIYQSVWNEIQFSISSSEQLNKTPEFEVISPLHIKYVRFEQKKAGDTDNLHMYRLSAYFRADLKTITAKSFTSNILLKIYDGGDERPHILNQQIEFLSPLEVKSKLHTAHQLKLLSLTLYSIIPDVVCNLSDVELSSMEIPADDCYIDITHIPSSRAILPLTQECEVTYAWKLDSNINDTIQLRYSVNMSTEPKSGKMSPTADSGSGEKNPNEEDVIPDRPLENVSCEFKTEFSVELVQSRYIMRRYLKPGIPTSPLTLSRQSSTSDILSPHIELINPFKLSADESPSHWYALCECEMVVELTVCDFRLTDEAETVSYEISADPSWAISGTKTGSIVLDAEKEFINVKLVPLIGGHLYLPSVKFLTSSNEEFLPGHVYDASKLHQVLVESVEDT